jgi:chromosome segregation ATPase
MDPNSVLTLVQVIQIVITTLVAVGAFWLSYRQWKRSAKKEAAETNKLEAEAHKTEDMASAEAAEALANAGEAAARTYKGLIETLNERLSKAEDGLKDNRLLAVRLGRAEKSFEDYRSLTDQRIASLNKRVEQLSEQLIMKQDTIDRLIAENQRLEEVIEGNLSRIAELEGEIDKLKQELTGGENASTD